MNENMLELIERREKLLERISLQRGQLTEIGSEMRDHLWLADKGMAVARFLRFHPLLVAGVAAIFLVRRRTVADIVWVGWLVWKIIRDLTSISAKLISRNYTRS